MKKTALISTLLAGAVLPAAAFAQDTTPTAAPAANAADDTGDVIVTARFRNESVQSVPIAITAITGQALAERQLNNIQNIATAVPSVEFRNGASNKDRTIFIRGVGTITTSPGVEPSVSTVLDGVVLTRPGQSTLDLGEVERIEVLRGPQGTLFGKNASAGVVNIVTRNPTDETQAFGEVGATTDREYRIKAGVSGALVPGKVQALIGGLYTKWDGNVRNTVNNHRVNGFRRYGARGKLLVEATPDLKFTAIARLSQFARRRADQHLSVDLADRLSDQCGEHQHHARHDPDRPRRDAVDAEPPRGDQFRFRRARQELRRVADRRTDRGRLSHHLDHRVPRVEE